jgi:ElaB/YqjD/DUF883 family membrane-anchored ribosome-binding protein
MASGRPIETTIDLNVDGVVSGAEKVASTFDDVQDSLKDTAKAGDKSFESMEDSAKEAAKTIDRDLTKALDEVDAKVKDSGKSGKNIGDGIKDGTSKAKGSLHELKEEANSTAKEATASFDGSAQGIADAFQEVAANTFGPIGLAAAIGVGIAIAKMQELAEVNTEAKEKMADLGREIYDAGGKIDDAAIADKIKDIAFALKKEDNPWTPWADEAKTGIGVVKDALEGLDDVSAKDVFEGLAGDLESGQRAFDQLTKSIDEDRKALEKHVSYTDQGLPVYDAEGQKLEESIKKREELRGEIEKASGATKGATDEVKFYTDAMGESTDAVEDRIQAEEKLAGINRSAVENEIDYNKQLAETSKGITERGKATDKLSEAGQANNLALLDLTETGTDYLKGLYDQGVGADSLAAKVAAVRQNFIDQAVAAGYSKDEAANLASAYGLVPPEVLTKIKTEGGDAAKAEIDGIPATKDATVAVKTDGLAQAQGEITDIEGTTAPVQVTDEGTSKETQGRIDGIKGRDLVKIDVDDDYTVKAVQDRIDGMHGKTIPIRVEVANEFEFMQTIARLTQSATKIINVETREGVKND